MNLIQSTTAALLTLSLFCAGSAQAQGQYQSIADIRQSTPARWQETYETQWRTVTVDTPVEVPDVEQFPIIRIVPRNAVEGIQLAAYDEIMENVKGNFSARIGPPTHVVVNNEWPKFPGVYFYHGEVPDIKPENNPLPYEDAVGIITDECARLFGDVQLSMRYTTIMSRVYRYKIVNGKREWLDPVTEKGQYFIVMDQAFRGINYESSTECYDVLGLPHESYMMCNPYVCYTIYDANSYNFVIGLDRELDEIDADVPILPFADAKAAIEKEITAGYLRSVDEIKLCYAPYYDPGDDSILWLLPVWYAKGAYTRDRSREFTPWLDKDGTVIDNGVEYREIVFQAQSGTLMDYNDSRANRRKVPDILTWDDVR